MVGQEFKSEKRSFRDSKTGREIWQLTSGNTNNYQFYFTDNSFSLGDREIYFLSDRGGRPEVFNIFRMDLDTGAMVQLTDEPDGVTRCTKSPDSQLIVYVVGNRIKKLNTATGLSEVLYVEESDAVLGMLFISHNKKYVGVVMNENVHITEGANYAGFKETMFATKRGWIKLIYMDGSHAFTAFEDTHWLGHFQFAPDDSTLATFCHEGPWNLVQQRIWLLDLVSGKVSPCFRQQEDDSVGHEFWTRDGLIFFDNRRKGHDGTITSSHAQATFHPTGESQKPYIGFADKTGRVIRRIDMPFYCNHYHANNDNTLLVGDEVDDLVLIGIADGKASLHTLCNHGTSWYMQRTHCHPTFSWGADKILYTSDREGKCNLYLVPDVEYPQ